MGSFIHSFFFYDSPAVLYLPMFLPLYSPESEFSNKKKWNSFHLTHHPLTHTQTSLIGPNTSSLGREEDDGGEAIDDLKTQDGLKGYPPTVCHPSFPIPGQLHGRQVVSYTALISSGGFQAGDKEGRLLWGCQTGIKASIQECACFGCPRIQGEDPAILQILTWVAMGCLVWRYGVWLCFVTC